MFSRPPKKFILDSEATTPFEKARAEWDDRDGGARVQSYNWRIAAISLIGVVGLLTCGLIFQSTKSTVTPYVIEVDSTTGMAKNVGPIQAHAYSPKEAEIKYFLTEYIKNTREVPLDPVVFTEKWNKAYAYMTKSAANKMNTIMQNEQPMANLTKKTVQVNILVIVPMGNNSYQVRWTEEEFLIGSGQKTVVPMSGVFTTYLNPPTNEKELAVNPLGVYISDFNWSRESATK